MSPEYAQEWVRKAEADRAAAEVCLKQSGRIGDLSEIACFHAQQCAEKYLKALIAKAGKAPPRTHELEALARMIGTAARARLARQDLERLNAYAVDIRYPGSGATRREARLAVAAMNRLRLKFLRTLRGD